METAGEASRTASKTQVEANRSYFTFISSASCTHLTDGIECILRGSVYHGFAGADFDKKKKNPRAGGVIVLPFYIF